MHAEPVAGLQRLQGEGVVPVERLLVVDRDGIEVGQVLPVSPNWRECRRRRPRLIQGLRREVPAYSRPSQLQGLVRVEYAGPDQHLEAGPLEVASRRRRRLHQLPSGLPAGELLAMDRVALQYLDQRSLVGAHRLRETARGHGLDQLMRVPCILGLAPPPLQQVRKVLPRPRPVLPSIAHEKVRGPFEAEQQRRELQRPRACRPVEAGQILQRGLFLLVCQDVPHLGEVDLSRGLPGGVAELLEPPRLARQDAGRKHDPFGGKPCNLVPAEEHGDSPVSLFLEADDGRPTAQAGNQNFARKHRRLDSSLWPLPEDISA